MTPHLTTTHRQHRCAERGHIFTDGTSGACLRCGLVIHPKPDGGGERQAA